MPRKTLIRSGVQPYHVTARCNNREPFPCSLQEAWKFITAELFVQSVLHDLEIHAFVLMPNHFHLLLTVPSGNLDRPMKGLMESSTRIINTKARRCGHLFGGRYYWSLIGSSVYFAHALKYVYRNPVKAGLSPNAEEYLFSTLHQILGHSEPSVRLGLPNRPFRGCIPEDPWDLLRWIETPYADEESDAIRRALRRREFKLPVRASTRKPLAIETDI